MRMGELSSTTGIPAATIKFYLREGLLPAGDRTSPNQVQYAETHVRRLRLIRALVEVGGLSVSSAREVLNHLDSVGTDALDTLGKVQYSLTKAVGQAEDEAARRSHERVDELLAERGWWVRSDNPALQTLTQVLATLDRLDQGDVSAMLDRYVDTVDALVQSEVGVLAQRQTLEERAEAVVVFAVLGDVMLSALRRIVQEDRVRRAMGSPPPEGLRRMPLDDVVAQP